MGTRGLALRMVDEQRLTRLRSAIARGSRVSALGRTHQINRLRIDKDSQHGKDVAMVLGEVSISEAEQLQVALCRDDEWTSSSWISRVSEFVSLMRTRPAR